MNYTTDEMKTVAGTIARKIAEQGVGIGVSQCNVDDFGQFGNFSLICYLDVINNRRGYKPKQPQKFSLLKIVYLIKRIILEHKKDNAILRCHESPAGVYTSNSCNGMRLKSDFAGYERSYISIDLDFIPFNSNSNTFAVQSPIEHKNDAQLSLF